MFLQAGRILPQDVQTLKTILKACPSIGDNYGIIINKSLDMERMKANMDKITTSLYAGFKEAGLPTSCYIHCWPEEDAVNNKDNVLPSLPQDLVDFIDSVPVVGIKPSDVSPLDVQDYDAEVDRLNSVVEKLLADGQRMTLMLHEQQKDFQAQMLEQQRRAEESAERQHKWMQQALRDQQEAAASQTAALRASLNQQQRHRREDGIGTKILQSIPLLGAF